ncbi:hypothetical protein ACH5RR_002147 [Cinchona calisaya]|uniref:Uncharacterized protein n=1 Tax=Cinchona calisaya TaxID=153742 RepID=A0ABD3B5U2_9GENT
MQLSWMRFRLILLLLLLFLVFHINLAQTIVKTLPGYPGTLPFKLETGYVSVGESEDVELFYYFIESERDPIRDPLVLWLAGGPGCSAFSAIAYELGPLAFDVEAFNGSLPSLLLNPYAWTKIANIIFLDSPVGTGFSYATTLEGYYSSDTKSAKDTYNFLRKWLLNHPKFTKNRLYIGGDSYGGKIVPIIVYEILKGNKAGLMPQLSVEGYLLGNPGMAIHQNFNWRIPYANRMALVSDEHFKRAKRSCHGEYVSPNPNNTRCLFALQPVNECIDNINKAHILEPKCQLEAAKSDGLKRDFQNFLREGSIGTLHTSYQEIPWCRENNYVPSYVWANDPTVQDALQVRNGTKEEWRRCNKSLSYDINVASVLHYHQALSRERYQVLVYSGDHDMIVPYISTLEWINDLNLTLDEDWRPWTFTGQIAGYTLRYRYKEDQFYLTFATVKGAGHAAPEYKPKECLAMIERWFSYYPL